MGIRTAGGIGGRKALSGGTANLLPMKSRKKVLIGERGSWGTGNYFAKKHETRRSAFIHWHSDKGKGGSGKGGYWVNRTST